MTRIIATVRGSILTISVLLWANIVKQTIFGKYVEIYFIKSKLRLSEGVVKAPQALPSLSSGAEVSLSKRLSNRTA